MCSRFKGDDVLMLSILTKSHGFILEALRDLNLNREGFSNILYCASQGHIEHFFKAIEHEFVIRFR